MNIFYYLILGSCLLYGYFYDDNLWHIFFITMIFYSFLELIYRKGAKNTLKSKMFFSNWVETGNPMTYLTIDLDVTNALQFIEEYN